MEELSNAIQLWDAFEKSNGKTSVALAGDWPDRLKTFRVGHRSGARATKEKKVIDEAEKRKKDQVAK